MGTPTFIRPEPMSLKEWHAEDAPQPEEKPIEIQSNEAYTPTLFQGDDFNQFLDSLSSNEFDALEKFLMEEFFEDFSKESQQIEIESQESALLERVRRVRRKLNRYGPEEHTRRLPNEDPEFTKQLAEFRRNGTSQKGEDTKCSFFNQYLHFF